MAISTASKMRPGPESELERGWLATSGRSGKPECVARQPPTASHPQTAPNLPESTTIFDGHRECWLGML